MNKEHSVDDGTPVRTASWPSWPSYDEDEIKAVEKVLRSGKVNYWTGEQGRKFEQEYADYCHRKHAVAVSNGSVALELALRSLGIGEGDEVIVPSRSFVASASSIVLVNARPVFSDIDPVSQVVTVDTLSQVVTDKTKAIIVVHLAGWPCEMNDIMQFAAKRKLYVIEDCAQAHGAYIDDRPVGSFGDIAAFSFCQDKIITTGGEGGMLVMDNDVFWKRSWEYKDHGKSHDDIYAATHKSGFRWVHKTFGTNWRLTEMQSAIGRLQLAKLPDWNKQRNFNAEYLNNRLRSIPGIVIHKPGKHISHAWYKYYAFIDLDLLKPGWTRNRIITSINAEGIPCITGSCSEIYLEESFQRAGFFPEKRLENAKKLAETSMMFQIHPTLSEMELGQTVEAVTRVMMAATVD